jgi:hypothetical protein
MKAAATSFSAPASPPTRLAGVHQKAKGEPNTTFRVYLDIQLPTAPISVFFVRLEADVGKTGVWDEED